MSAESEKQEGQKTVVAFVAGLLIGGLLVWIFSGPSEEKYEMDQDNDKKSEVVSDGDKEAVSTEESDSDVTSAEPAAATMVTGDGEIEVKNQAAGSAVAITGATFPNDDGWIAVRSYQNDQLGNILGAARFSKSQGLVPSEVPLLVPTTAGRSYAVVFFTEDGDREFNLASDVQVEGVWSTFVAE